MSKLLLSIYSYKYLQIITTNPRNAVIPKVAFIIAPISGPVLVKGVDVVAVSMANKISQNV